MGKIVLFNDKKDCCACGACMNICPKGAISMIEDETGFVYPHIDEEKCIECGACKRACSFQNSVIENQPLKCYAAVNKSQEQIMKSASGGIFAAIAANMIKNGGIVYGVTLDFNNGQANPHHISIESIDELYKLQGSKYVQSFTEYSYKEIKEHLRNDRLVLFSGTPCQVDGLYGYLGKEYDNLFTIDLICHGVPSARMFNDYLQCKAKQQGASEVIGYAFRDKSKGWGMNGRIDLRMPNGNKKSLYRPARLESYNTYFLDGSIYRENCYTCKYACSRRPGDLTIGDYWGIESEHPEIANNSNYNLEKGISSIIVNSNKGKEILNNTQLNLELIETEFSKIAKKNKQLNAPSKIPDNRTKILSQYVKNNYAGLNNYFYKNYKKQLVVHKIFNSIPSNLRRKLKKLMGK